MNSPLVINPGVDFNLEELVRRAFEEFETSTVEDVTEGPHDSDDEPPTAGLQNSNLSERNFSEGEVETRIKSEGAADQWCILANTASAGKSSTHRKNEKRRAKRKAIVEERKESERNTRQKTAMATTVLTLHALGQVDVSQDRMTARPLPESKCQPTMGEIKSKGYQIVEWDGRCVNIPQPNIASEHDLRTPQPIADSKGIVYVHLAGRPLAEQYTSVIERANRLMENAAEALQFRLGQTKGRRGQFNVINVGISSGTGNSVRLTKS